MRKQGQLVPHVPQFTYEGEKRPNPNWVRGGGQKRRSTRKTLTAVFDISIRAKEAIVVWEFAIRIFQPESAGTSVDETL